MKTKRLVFAGLLLAWGICGAVEAGWQAVVPDEAPAHIKPGSPAVGDLDGDGDLEIVGDVNVQLYAWHHDGALVSGWPVRFGGRGYPHVSTISLGNVDGVPGEEVVVCVVANAPLFNDETVQVIRGNGTIAFSSRNLVPFGAVNQFPLEVVPQVVIDVNNDGRTDIVTTSRIGVAVWNRDGMLPGWPVKLGTYGDDTSLAAAPAVADLNGDRQLEVIAVSQQRVYAWNANGALLPGWPVNLPAVTQPVLASPIVVTLHGKPAIIVTRPPSGETTWPKLYAFSAQGAEMGSWPLVGSLGDATPLAANLNGGGPIEILSASGSDSEQLRTIPVASRLAFQNDTLGEIKYSPVVARLATGERRVYLAASDGRLYAWDGRGIPVPPQAGTDSPAPVAFNASEPSSPTVADVDQNGTLELILISRHALIDNRVVPNRSDVRVIELGVSGTPEWGTQHHDAQRTGWLRR